VGREGQPPLTSRDVYTVISAWNAPFRVLSVWEQSRFGRDTARQLSAIQDITEAGVGRVRKTTPRRASA
jgi:hypothetical protein